MTGINLAVKVSNMKFNRTIFTIPRMMLIPIILTATLSFLLLECKEKRKVSQEIEALWSGDQANEPDSSGLVLIAKYCEKIRSCASEEIDRLTMDEKAILEKRLRPDICIQKFKETPVYRLEIDSPETAFIRTIHCLRKVVDSDCQSLKKGVSQLSTDCEWMYSAQKLN
ncbi:hypothetical protein LEP1GSC047_1267 [Leptospira inadai serovar Lyme str. 10]|uniref:Uncharacterized protein n=2 Tax=Leptospira inadai serovar Lyme TaxID=293084 RepID=V6H8N2_9LEPT|nr:hypothetical protein [Leptospira inadai]EQA35316.1 hypothetical protein LEP1GSC047_1267 [Leptospira inadai serovar Lyme str. 10]PNV75999.1 hypothetical protein BES34_005705 [Leptospira inadai serovar Lyme]